MLERLNCLVKAVATGEEAIDLLSRGEKFDLLLTDLGLPGMSGEELASRARSHFPDLPIVIASGYGRGAGTGDGIQFISKPYSAVDLQQALETARDRPTPP
jgi:CheY-like chemotaxis protein